MSNVRSDLPLRKMLSSGRTSSRHSRTQYCQGSSLLKDLILDRTRYNGFSSVFIKTYRLAGKIILGADKVQFFHFNRLEPRRIAAVPNTVLYMVVSGE